MVWSVCFFKAVFNVTAYKHSYKQINPIFSNSAMALYPWIFFLIFLLFPSKNKCNGQGRLFVYKRLAKCVFLCYYESEFANLFILDQLMSFVIPIKDVLYLQCFYRLGANNQAYQVCTKMQAVGNYYLIAMIPLILRFLHVLKTVYKNGKVQPRALFNTFKFTFAILVPIIQHLYIINNKPGYLLGLYILFTSLATTMMFGWDLKVDWGLCQPNCSNRWLRNNLAYNNMNYYYCAMAANLLLRLTWVLSLTPSMVTTIGVGAEAFIMVLGVLE